MASNADAMNGKVALITGGARGIGLATAKVLHAQGWRIALTDIDAGALEPAAAEIGPDTLTYVLDVADIPEVFACVTHIAAEAGRLDLLVNNAGLFRNENFLDTSEETYDKLMTVNVKGAFFMLQACAKAMIAAGNGGVIVNMSSASGRSGRATQAVYGLTKSAMIHLTKSAALALGSHGIRVAAICPAAIETDMWADTVAQRRAVGGEAALQAFLDRFPLHRSGQPEEVAELIAFFASEKAAFMTGTTLDISGGLEM